MGAGHAEERTENIWCMVVTLEVSKLSGWLNAAAPPNMPAMVVTPAVFQLEMSALKFVKPPKSPLMSVMEETTQLAMGPYVAMAAAGFPL